MEEFVKPAVIFVFGFIIGAGLRPMLDALDGVGHEANEWGDYR